ncbi:MAG: SPFH domain-containing protein, partial [Candidatus Spyradenecus sp.]
GNDAITFLTLDGFIVTAEGTLEFNLEEDKVALLTQEVGDMDDILQKLILPSARGFSRIEGSKKMATEFIVGKSRQDFQDKLEAYLREICAPRGISLNSVLIRDIFAPQSIAGIIRDRELAVQESRKIEQQIVQAESQAELGRQKALAAQNSAVVMEQTAQIQARISAEQRKTEQTIAAQAKLDVAKVAYEAALRNAEAKMTAAEAERRVIEARTKAFADVLRQEVGVYADEADYVRMKLYEKTAPRVQSILATPEAGAPFGLPLGAQTTPAAPAPAAPAQSTPAAPVQSVPAVPAPAAPVQP